MIKRVCVFCGSSPGTRPEYVAEAAALATHFVAEEIGIVYGGGKLGLMGTLADTALRLEGEIIGVIPDFLVAKEIAHSGVKDLRVVRSMHERKALMSKLSDAFVAMPGGYGTFEEFCEILTWTQLGLQSKACGLLNVAGYYDPLLRMFDHAVAEGFVKPAHRELLVAEDNPASLLESLRKVQIPSVNKWIDQQRT